MNHLPKHPRRTVKVSSIVLLSIVLIISTFTRTGIAQIKPGDTRFRIDDVTKPLSAQEVARRILPAVVLIICDDGNDDSSLASGFFVRPDVVVTNYHVIENMVQGRVRTATTAENDNAGWPITAVLNIDRESDLALVRVRTNTNGNIPVLSLASSENISVGETVYAFGNPEGLVGTISPGIVSGLRSSNKMRRIQITAPVSHGSSGGPVVNATGIVVGVAEGSMSAGQNLNFAVPSSLISSLIAGTNLKVTKAEVQAWESTQGNRWTWLAPEGEDILAGGLVPNTDFAGETRAWLTQNLAGARTDYRDGFRHRIENLTFSGCDITVSTSMEKGSVKLVVNHFTSMTLAENAAARKAKSGEFLVTLYFGSNITEYQQGYIDGHLVGRYYEEKTVRVIPLVVPNEDVAVRASQELNRLIKICDGSAARRP